jgi:hypothetical protein
MHSIFLRGRSPRRVISAYPHITFEFLYPCLLYKNRWVALLKKPYRLDLTLLASPHSSFLLNPKENSNEIIPTQKRHMVTRSPPWFSWNTFLRCWASTLFGLLLRTCCHRVWTARDRHFIQRYLIKDLPYISILLNLLCPRIAYNHILVLPIDHNNIVDSIRYFALNVKSS